MTNWSPSPSAPPRPASPSDNRPFFAKILSGQNSVSPCSPIRGNDLFARGISPSGNHVAHVVGVCAGHQMGRVAARRIVTRVADDQAFRHLAVGERICHPVRQYWSGLAIGTEAKSAIAGTVGGARPNPAFISSVSRRDLRQPYGELYRKICCNYPPPFGGWTFTATSARRNRDLGHHPSPERLVASRHGALARFVSAQHSDCSRPGTEWGSRDGR